jgi:hypothetical protein
LQLLLFYRSKHRQSRRQGLETQAKARMMLRAIRDMALSRSMYGVAAQLWSFFQKKYDVHPVLFLGFFVDRWSFKYCIFILPLRQELLSR